MAELAIAVLAIVPARSAVVLVVVEVGAPTGRRGLGARVGAGVERVGRPRVVRGLAARRRVFAGRSLVADGRVVMRLGVLAGPGARILGVVARPFHARVHRVGQRIDVEHEVAPCLGEAQRDQHAKPERATAHLATRQTVWVSVQ